MSPQFRLPLTLLAVALCLGASGCADLPADLDRAPAWPSAQAIGSIRVTCAATRSLLGAARFERSVEERRSRLACAGSVTQACYRSLGDGASGTALTDCMADGVARCEAEYRESCGARSILADLADANLDLDFAAPR